jgi:hypothetical protein
LDNDPKVVEKWIDVATDHGINVFVYDWYEEGPFLESAFNDGFLKARNNDKMQFYVMWANHDVKYNFSIILSFPQKSILLQEKIIDKYYINNY